MFFAIVWTGIVILLSVWPFSTGMDVGQTDKLVHFTMYSITTFLYYRWMKSIWMAALFSASLGFLMEVAQHFIEWRTFSLFDFLFNCAGVMIVSLWYYAVRGKIVTHGKDA